MELENISVQSESDRQMVAKQLVWSNAQMSHIMRIAMHIAPSKATVLVQGESGTGKELLCQYIHQNSARNKKAMAIFNTANLSEEALEQELFGIEKGNSLNLAPRVGKLEFAHQGTLLIDEIANMSVNTQGKLLKVIQENSLERIGGKTAIPLNVRIIATTTKDLKEAVRKGDFRKDLYYRLNVIKLSIPSLRERKDDIPKLVDYFVQRHASGNGMVAKAFSHDALDKLMNYSWPGNVRELENVVERSLLTAVDDTVRADDILIDATIEQLTKSDVSIFEVEDNVPLHEVEKRYIVRTLGRFSGNRTHAARALGISIRTLRNKINEYRKENIIL